MFGIVGSVETGSKGRLLTILWNSLPQDVKAAESITSFKTMAKLHLSR